MADGLARFSGLCRMGSNFDLHHYFMIGQSASVIDTLLQLGETYKSAKWTILSMVAKCETVQFAWRNIKAWANENLHRVANFEDLKEKLQRSLGNDLYMLSALQKDLDTMVARSNGIGRWLGFLRNDAVFRKHQSRLRGQVATLQHLLRLLRLYEH
jgi:hypothetical protein